MGSFQGKKYDVLQERTYSLDSIVDQAYTTGSNLFSSNLTAPANGYITISAISSVDKNVAYVLLNAKSSILFSDLSNGEMKVGIRYTIQIPVANANTINFTFSKSANITLSVNFTGIVS